MKALDKARIIGGALLGVFVLATLAFSAPYPRTMLYAASKGSGVPFSRADGSLDSALVRGAAQHDLITLNVVPWTDGRGDLIALLKSYNPSLLVLGYDLLGQRFPYGGNNQWAREWVVVNNGHGLLRGTDGKLFPDTLNPWVNLGDRTVVDALALLWIGNVLAAPGVDGVFLDLANAVVGWAHGPTGATIDYRLAGFATMAQMDSARTANLTRFCNAIRTAYPQALIVGNGTTPDALKLAVWDGDMFEAWPQARGGFDASLSAYLAAGPYSVVKVEGGWSGAYTIDACRLARFALGSACMGQGFGYFGPDRDIPPVYLNWIHDEASVTAWPSRRSDVTGAHRGWLGVAAGAAYHDSSGAWVRKFPGGAVIVNGTTHAATVDLGFGAQNLWARIYGTRDPMTNNGRASRTYTVPAYDALFLSAAPPKPRAR